jgi:hypothetical protein
MVLLQAAPRQRAALAGDFVMQLRQCLLACQQLLARFGPFAARNHGMAVRRGEDGRVAHGALLGF